MKTILMMGCALALLFAAVPQPVMAANSQMNLTVGTTNDAKAGDTVTVRLVGSNNPGLSTFAARLAYDDSDLEYVGTHGQIRFLRIREILSWFPRLRKIISRHLIFRQF